MTTELQSREEADTASGREHETPDVLFEEARRRRRRRWMAGSAVASAWIIAAALLLGTGGGGGGGVGRTAHAQPHGSGSGAGSGHANASRLFAGAPASTGRYYVGPGTSCPMAPRSRYLPAGSGCVTAMVVDLSGNGRRDLVLIYSRLGKLRLQGLPPRREGSQQSATRYPAEQAMLRVVSADGHVSTAPIDFTTTPFNKAPAQLERAEAAALISVAHVGDGRGKEIFLQVQQISSGSTVVAYHLYRGRLIPSGVVLGYGGDGGTRAGFQCLSGNPPRVSLHNYELTRLIHEPIYGWWTETTTTYAWHGPRLVKIAQSIVKRPVSPRDNVGVGCRKGFA